MYSASTVSPCESRVVEVAPHSPGPDPRACSVVEREVVPVPRVVAVARLEDLAPTPCPHQLARGRPGAPEVGHGPQQEEDRPQQDERDGDHQQERTATDPVELVAVEEGIGRRDRVRGRLREAPQPRESGDGRRAPEHGEERGEGGVLAPTRGPSTRVTDADAAPSPAEAAPRAVVVLGSEREQGDRGGATPMTPVYAKCRPHSCTAAGGRSASCSFSRRWARRARHRAVISFPVSVGSCAVDRLSRPAATAMSPMAVMATPPAIPAAAG